MKKSKNNKESQSILTAKDCALSSMNLLRMYKNQYWWAHKKIDEIQSRKHNKFQDIIVIILTVLRRMQKNFCYVQHADKYVNQCFILA